MFVSQSVKWTVRYQSELRNVQNDMTCCIVTRLLITPCRIKESMLLAAIES